MWLCAAWPNLESSGVFNGLQYFLIGLLKLKIQTNDLVQVVLLYGVCTNAEFAETQCEALHHQ
jgi:hypothetical protein